MLSSFSERRHYIFRKAFKRLDHQIVRLPPLRNLKNQVIDTVVFLRPLDVLDDKLRIADHQQPGFFQSVVGLACENPRNTAAIMLEGLGIMRAALIQPAEELEILQGIL